MRQSVGDVIAHHALTQIQGLRDRSKIAPLDNVQYECLTRLGRQLTQCLAKTGNLLHRYRMVNRRLLAHRFVLRLSCYKITAYFSFTQTIDGEVACDPEQVTAQRLHVLAVVQRKHAQIGILRDFLRIGVRIQPTLKERDQRTVMLAEQFFDLSHVLR